MKRPELAGTNTGIQIRGAARDIGRRGRTNSSRTPFGSSTSKIPAALRGSTSLRRASYRNGSIDAWELRDLQARGDRTVRSSGKLRAYVRHDARSPQRPRTQIYRANLLPFVTSCARKQLISRCPRRFSPHRFTAFIISASADPSNVEDER